MGAALKQGNETMANIGTFTSNGNGFTGTIRTLTLNVKARLVRIENPSDKGPHFRIFAAANVELGAAWQKHSDQTDRDYLSVKLDDPSFRPDLRDPGRSRRRGGLQLIWSGRTGTDPGAKRAPPQGGAFATLVTRLEGPNCELERRHRDSRGAFLYARAGERGRRLFRLVEGLHHRLAIRSDATPIPNERRAAEQRRLKRKRVEAPHVQVRINAMQMELFGILAGHVVSLASFGSDVQRHL